MQEHLEVLRTAFIFLCVIPIVWYWLVKGYRFLFKHSERREGQENGAPPDVITDIMTYGLGTIVVVMTSFIVAFSVSYSNTETIYEGSNNIVAIQDNSSFVVSRRSSDSKHYYHYMVKANEAYKQHRAPVDRTSIYYVDSKSDARIEYYDEQATSSFLRWLFPFKVTGTSTYKIYVPKGTIKEEFIIDLE